MNPVSIESSRPTVSDRRKLPRFHLSPCQFHIVADAARNILEKNFSVHDISLGGLSIHLVDGADLARFPVGSTHQGTLKVEGEKHEAQFIVRYLRGLVIGGEWVALSVPLRAHLTKILSAEHLGSTLKKFPLTDTPNIDWYHASAGVDLILYRANDPSEKLERWILYLHHSFLQWERAGMLQSGQALAQDEESSVHGLVRIETRLLDFDPVLDLRLVELARDFFHHAKVLPEAAKNLLIHHVEGQLS